MAISAQAYIDDLFYDELLKFLKLAEKKRRWNVFEDIPWHLANPDTSDTLAHCVETFCAVELYLPDFTSKLLEMIRNSRAKSWFHINWGYEESKHSLALEAWLLASGHRTEDQRKAFVEEMLEATWYLPFDHPRRMIAYTMIQELATFWNYRNLEKMATQEQDPALVTALRVISVDERVHYNFYRNMVKEWLKMDEAGTVEDIKFVFDNFTMPGSSQIPRYDESARILSKTGIYGPREYVKLVKWPILEDLGIDRDFAVMEKASLKRAQEREAILQKLERERIDLSEGAVARNTSRRAPLLEIIGIEPKQRTPSSSIILPDLPGSRGMQGYDELDQQLMIIGDEKSNNSEDMRSERAKIRSNRGKNNRLHRQKEPKSA